MKVTSVAWSEPLSEGTKAVTPVPSFAEGGSDMSRHQAIGLVALSALLTATGAVAQPASQPTGYTFVAQWQMPRAQWANFVADFEKNTLPVLEKMAKNGTLVGWGAFEAVVHTEEGFTHGIWWSSATTAGIEQTRAELIKASAASGAIAAATGHRDYYLRSILGNGKSGAGSGGYLTVSSSLVKPGQGQDWRQAFEKNIKPIFDEMVAKGVFVGYSVDVERVHTDSPGWRYVATLSPNAEAEDKISAAFEAADAKLTAEERKSRQAAAQAMMEQGAHRDLHAGVIRYWRK
jgi:hypothetical protein